MIWITRINNCLVILRAALIFRQINIRQDTWHCAILMVRLPCTKSSKHQSLVMSYDRYVFEEYVTLLLWNFNDKKLYWIPCLMSHISRKERVSNLPILSYKLATITILSRHKSIRRTCHTAKLCGIGIVSKKVVCPFIYMNQMWYWQLYAFPLKPKEIARRMNPQLRNMLQLSV
jgi:hypothetical protein